MKKQILNLGKVLGKTEQKTIKGGGYWPTNERDCILCGGEWKFAGLCGLPMDSVCLQ